MTGYRRLILCWFPRSTAEERRKQAEMTVLGEKLENAVNKLVIKGIQGSIDRADKVYEGIKKVMDFHFRLNAAVVRYAFFLSS